MPWRQDQLSWDLLLGFLPLSSAGEGRHEPLLSRWGETTVSKMESSAVNPKTGPRALPGRSHRIWYSAATTGTEWDITTSISVTHPDTCAPAEQRHPLSQVTSPRWSCSRHKVPGGVSCRSVSAFPSLQQVLPVPAASPPALGHTGGDTAGATRVRSCRCLHKPC